jgi:hypothetical protein
MEDGMSETKKVFLVRDLLNHGYLNSAESERSPALWAFPDLEQAAAARDRFEADRRANADSWEKLDSPCYGIEERLVETRPPSSKRPVYVVQQLHWEYNDNWYDIRTDEPIKAFRDRDSAELHRLELEEKVRDGGYPSNPCEYAGGLAQASSLTEEQVVARLQEWGVPPPPRTTDGRAQADFYDDAWWLGLRERLSRRQFFDVWDLFDKVRFYEVVEINLDQ